MPRILEIIITTVSPQGRVHLAPMGVRHEHGRVLMMPFRPSATLDNVLARGRAVLNVCDDVRVFAGCVTARRDWPTEVLRDGQGVRLTGALSHVVLQLDECRDDPVRPQLVMVPGEPVIHRPFAGFNRAQAAVIEAAVLVSRLDMLPEAKLAQEMAYLQIAIDKTAGPQELEAWQWLQQAIAEHALRRDGAVPA